MDTAQRQAALAFAVQLAQAPHDTIMQGFRSTTLAIETKLDGSPVTTADRQAESIMRHMIRASSAFGHDQILGEEAGVEGEPSRYRWILDPIDGTLSFSRGLPLFGTLVALEDAERGESVVGAIHLPCFHETYVAARGLGSWCNGEPVRASTETNLRTALISAPDPLQLRCAGLAPAFYQLWDRCDRLRGYTDCWVHVQAVRGTVDAVIEPHVNVWDIRATQLLVEEAGGMQLTRDSTTPGMYDCLFGSPALVERLAGILGF